MDTKNIEYWKNAKIDYAIFIFSCGGDSMGDTELTFYDANSNPIEVDLSFQSLIEDMIYSKVEFYVNSDGHYLGESGKVTIKLEDDEFDFTKESTSEYCEWSKMVIDYPLEDDELELLNKYIKSFSSSNEGYSSDIDWKETLELTSDIKLLCKSFIDDDIENYVSDILINDTDFDGEFDSFYYRTNKNENENGIEIFEHSGKFYLKLFVDFSTLIQVDGD
jgi:hypothetical protein